MKPATFTARVAAIVSQAQRPLSPTLTEDHVNHRLVIAFQAMPSAEVCALLKRHGFQFRGGPVQAWVRPITPNARTAAASVMAALEQAKCD